MDVYLDQSGEFPRFGYKALALEGGELLGYCLDHETRLHNRRDTFRLALCETASDVARGELASTAGLVECSHLPPAGGDLTT